VRRILIPAALTVFAAAIVVVSLVPDGTERSHVTTGDLRLAAPTMTDAEELLSAAVLANGTVSFEGTLTVVGVEGPNVFQIEVEAEADGTRMVNSGSWLFGRGGGERWASSDSGESMEASADTIPDVDMEALLDKYRLHVAGVRELPTGPAHVVVVTERASGVEREWLSVDDTTGMLVRRETFDDEGAALRLVAFETLRTSGVVGQALPRLQFPIDLPDTLNGIDISELPGHFRLQGVASHDEAVIPTTGLLFSDGLYRLSIYSQEGGLDGSSLRGAVREHWGDMDLYRWPGAEPQRLVWSGDGHTYTAITNAPMDAVLPALSQFPSDPVGGLLERMRRGASRVANTIWPFD
jgi:hypothetical protein